MPRKFILLTSLVLILLFAACAKRTTENQEPEILTLLRQIPVVGDPLDISFDAANIYIAQDQGGISVIDGSNYSQRWFTELASTDSTMVPLFKIRKISAVGEHQRLFLNETDLGGTDKIQIVDISVPDTLRVIDAITGASQDIQDMIFRPIPNTVDDNIIEVIYCAGRNVHYGRYNGDLWLGSTFSIYPPAPAVGIDLTDNYVFVAAEQRGLLIYNRADQALVGELAVPGEARKVKVAGNYAYIASRQGGLNVVDISNPAAPVKVSSFDTAGYASSIDVQGTKAVVSSGSGGVYLFDVTVPESFFLLQRLNSVGYTNNAKFYGDKLIVASRDQGILIYEID